MQYICPDCNMLLEIIQSEDGDVPECPLCGREMQILKVEKYNPELDRMIMIIQRERPDSVWKEIEHFGDWHYRVKMRKLFFEAVNRLKIPFQMDWEE